MADPTIGSSVFLVCESQEVAAEKYTALVANDSSRPEALLAPNAQEVIWKNVGRSGKLKALNVLLFWVILIGLFVAYLWGQTVLMGTLYKSETSLTETFLHILSSCKTVEVAETQCPFALSISQMLYTMIPTMTYCILMGLLPVLVDYAILLLGYPSVSKNKDLLYRIIFIFLILIMGIIQVVFPSMIDMNTGSVDITFLRDIDVQTFIENMGNNVVDQQFTFINYIINKYLTFPIFSLLNIYGIFVWLMAQFRTNALDKNYDLRTITMNFPKELAYMTHMFVIGFIFCVTAPVTNVIICVTEFLFTAIDLYFVLYMVSPTVISDLSSQANMMLNVIGTIFIGLVFMLIATFCFYTVQGGEISVFGQVCCVLCLFVSILFKFSIDKRFKRALSELSRSDYSGQQTLDINPAHIRDEYEEKNNYASRYNVGDPKENAEASELLGKPARTYKMNWRDKLLAAVYTDLTKLPISLVRVDDVKRDEYVCRVLEDERTMQHHELDNSHVVWTDERGQGFGQEEVDIMSAYTHPALNQVVIGSNI